jgi:hypothetical protein
LLPGKEAYLVTLQLRHTAVIAVHDIPEVLGGSGETISGCVPDAVGVKEITFLAPEKMPVQVDVSPLLLAGSPGPGANSSLQYRTFIGGHILCFGTIAPPALSLVGKLRVDYPWLASNSFAGGVAAEQH